MVGTRKGVPEERRQRLAALNNEAASRRQALMADAPNDPLGALAWLAGLMGPSEPPFNNELRDLIERAREDSHSWREISVALGEGEDDKAVRAVAARQRWRNRYS